MKRSIQNTALAVLLGAAGAHAAAQTTAAGTIIDYRAEPAPAVSTPGHDHRAGMDMGAQQCKKDDGKCCCCHKEAT